MGVLYIHKNSLHGWALVMPDCRKLLCKLRLIKTMKLQTGSARTATRLTKNDAQVGGSLEVGHKSHGIGTSNTVATDAYFKLPTLTTAQRNALTAEEGMVVYDTTLGKDMVYRGGGWGASDGTAASSLDAAYNGGASITVDSGAVTLTDTQTGTGGGLLITKSGVITGANSASIFHINSTGAHDTSGDVKFLEISVGAETISGSVYGIEIAMNANSDSGITITKGAMTLTDGALTLTSGNFTMSSGNADITGTLDVSSTAAFAGAVTVGTTLVVTGNTTAGGTLTVDTDSATAFVVQEEDGTAMLTCDTTQDAADTSMLLTTKVTTGTGVHIDGSTITSGDALKITVAAATMTAAGAALSIVADGTEVFAVRDDGTILSKGTAEGTDAITITTGDLTISDGDIIVSGGEASITGESNTAATLEIVNNTVTTYAAMVDVSSTSITTGALMRLNANNAGHDGEVLEIISGGDATSTPVGMSVTIASPTTGAARGIEVTMAGATTTAKGIAITMDAITTGDMLYLDNGGDTMTAGSGFFINCNDDDSSKFTVSKYGATTIAGTAAGTASLTLSLGDLVISDTDSTTITSVDGTGSIVEIISGGAIGADKACLEIDAAGTFNADGSLLRLSAEGVTATNSPFAMQIDAAALDMGAINIVSAPTTNSAIVATTTGALAADKAILELVSNAAACNADSAVARIEQTATDGVATCMALKQDDLDIPFITFETTIGTGNAIEAVGAKSVTHTHFIMVDIEGVGTRYIGVGTIA